MNKEEIVKRLSAELKEGEVIFEYDDGWNAEEYHKGKLEDGVYKTLDNYTWEGRVKVRTRWSNFSYKPEEIKILTQ